MANHKSAKKRIVRNESRRQINKSNVSKMRTFIKKLESFIKAGDKKAAQETFKTVTSEIAKNAKRGTMHKKTAARKTSRLAKKVKAVK